MAYYDRYKEFRVDDFVDAPMPFIPIPESDTDIKVVFDGSKMRLDSLSYKYYGDPNYSWLILNANPEVSPYEYLIDNGTELRIPYPIASAIERYEKSIEKYELEHGNGGK